MQNVLRCSFSRFGGVGRFGDYFISSASSYNDFLYGSAEKDGTLTNILSRFLSASDSYGCVKLEYVSHRFEEPKLNVLECKSRYLTYAKKLYVVVRLLVYDLKDGKKVGGIRYVKESEVCLCEFPIMVDDGVFIINGLEKVVVSQIKRSPGVFFSNALRTNGQMSYLAGIRPHYGNKLEYEVNNDGFYCKVGRYRKFRGHYFLRAVGFSWQEIVEKVYDKFVLTYEGSGVFALNVDISSLCNKTIYLNIRNENGEILVKSGNLITKRLIRQISASGNKIYCNASDLVGSTLYSSFSSGKRDYNCCYTLQDGDLEDLKSGTNIEIIDRGSDVFCDALLRDICDSYEETEEDVFYKLMSIFRPHIPFVLEEAREYFNNMFFSDENFSITRVGRRRMNRILKLDLPDDFCCLSVDDIIATTRRLFAYKNGVFHPDDVDSLSNRRISNVGEVVSSVFIDAVRGLVSIATDKLNGLIIDNTSPSDYIVVNAVSKAVNDFFVLSDLCQFMEQTNILSEITHIRKVTALGAGGISKDAATANVRDIHDSHYGRICPIETPDGQNIGLVVSLSCFARVNEYGFVEVPYRKVSDGKIEDRVVYLDVEAEKDCKIADISDFSTRASDLDNIITVRLNGDFVSARVRDVDYVSIATCQITSMMSFFIPFVESNDTARALMGCNMMRQAVPLLFKENPFVATGIEKVVGDITKKVIKADMDGEVNYVDANVVVLKGNDGTIKSYPLITFDRTNQDTLSNQQPVVCVGERVKKGDVLADVASTNRGEVSIGKNILVGFLPWRGYNYEDSVVISRKLVSDDKFTSVHIREFEVQVRDTQLGAEKTTNNIDGIDLEKTKYLDESGIVHIGSVVSNGDILVGKVTPVGEKFSTSEDRLLQAIFGDIDGRKKDTSLYVPYGVSGVVVGVDILTKRGEKKDDRALQIEAERINRRKRIFNLEIKALSDSLGGDNSSAKYKKAKAEIESQYMNDVARIMDGDTLPNGVIKIVKVYVAVRSRLQAGDKISGRHGNKGVVARCVAVEDMPYMEDGTPLDLVFSPVSIPGRMNVGQILETHLGWLSYNVGKKIDEALLSDEASKNVRKILEKVSLRDNRFVDNVKKMSDSEVIEFGKSCRRGLFFETPIFDSASVNDMEAIADSLGIDRSLQVQLYDGLTGEPFDRKSTVGYMYILKLHHLVDEKVYARSTGSYSMVTQQPLGGRAHGGGQRLGEMECWALQAYGAAYTLQEMLTVKSDDVSGRRKMYESIIAGGLRFKSGVPETFNVLCREFRSLGFDVELGLIGG